jgi:O-succinylbenzoic acid--CoA ligase
MSDTIRCPIAENFLKSPDALSMRTEKELFSYDQLEQQTRYFVQKLRSLGVKKGERVGILSENTPLIVSAIFALYRLEATALFLSLQLTPHDWASQLAMAHVKVIIGQDAQISRLKEVPQTVLSFTEVMAELETATRIESLEPRDIILSNESSIIFTSSKTGHKKGVILTIENFTASATASNTLTGLGSGDWWGVSLPLYHVGGLGIIFRTLFAGAGSNFLNGLSSRYILSELSKHNLTHLSLVPTVLDELISESEKSGVESLGYLSSMKAFILAGAASSKQLLGKIVQFDLPVLSAWGMTETTAHCTCMSIEDPREKVSTVGRPFHHTSLKLVDDGREVSDEGEILVKGPTVCKGYLDPSAPAPKIVNEWLYTGDLGSIDREGYLTIKGRIDDMFISGGENIHAAEIESAIKGYWKVKDVAIIPVSHPKWGHRPVMVAETKDGFQIEIEEIKEYLTDKIAKIKIPDEVHIVPELPRTAIGKINYKELKKVYTERE